MKMTFAMVLLSVGALAGCTKNFSVKDATQAGAVTPPNVSMKPMAHDTAQCPAGITGSWVEKDSEAEIPSQITVSQDNQVLTEKENGSKEQIVIDGTVKTLENSELLSDRQYVGACQNGKIVFKATQKGADGVVSTLDVTSEVNGDELKRSYRYDGAETETTVIYARSK
jgi:hypothetical protein